jgi:transposase InsO family protein
MIIRMQQLERMTLEEMREFVRSNRKLGFEAEDREALYGLVERVLQNQRYSKLGKKERGVVRQFLIRVSGLSRAQTARLIGQWMSKRQVRVKEPVRRRFPTHYTAEDIVLLSQVDAAHEDLSGPAVRRILWREYSVYGKREYERLAEISVSHLYNLRRSQRYRKLRVKVEHTRASQVAIGERRKPNPRGEPGFLRVDTVHQGHRDGQPGLYHINAVDTVTQWQVVGCVETIAERHLVPVLEAMLHQFPFRIRGFHCDNGSEFINHTVARLLEKLRVEFTKSRAYRTTDNALVEGKNGAVVRKQIGYGPIAAEHAEAFQKFYAKYFNPYLNYHRPCGFAQFKTWARGRRRRIYPVEDYRTPFEKLSSLPNWEQHLKPGVTAAALERLTRQFSDTEAARQMQQAKRKLLAQSRKSGSRATV